MDPRRLEELRAEARYRRERYELYVAKAYGMRETSPVRLRELERAWRAAEERLAAAKRFQAADDAERKRREDAAGSG